MNHEASKLLVPLDGSRPGDEALTVATSLAEVVGAELYVLHVSPSPLSPAALRHAVHIREELLPGVRLLNATGHAGPAIREVARSIRADAILISSHGVTGDLRRTAGHVTIDVLADAPCPVYVVRSALDPRSQAHRLRHLRRVLVPLDRSSDATAAVRYASSLALVSGAQLHLLHVLSDDPAARRAPVTPPYTDQPQHELAAWTEEFMRESFALEPRPEKLECRCALRVGAPGEQIAVYAEDEDCDLIVAAWAGSLVPGRAAVVRTLLQRARCPLLFVLANAESAQARVATEAISRS